ncbi:MAG: hypothetical protein NT154_40925, partial [Verrucomicrobia bacterium]|nr:hypothetical protein [Verrucomicrobiota bacterium]
DRFQTQMPRIFTNHQTAALPSPGHFFCILPSAFIPLPPSPDRSLAGHAPDTRRCLAVDNFEPNNGSANRESHEEGTMNYVE